MKSIKGVMSWFSKQISELNEVREEIGWQEDLDTAVQKIHEIPDIETDIGKKKLTKILKNLK